MKVEGRVLSGYVICGSGVKEMICVKLVRGV